MSLSSDVSLGAAHEFCITAGKAGFSETDISNLTQDEKKLRELLPAVRGYADVVIRPLNANLRAQKIDNGWGEHLSLVNHDKNGIFTWDDTKISLIMLPSQLRSDLVLRKERWANATILQYLVMYPDLVPKSWWELNRKFGHGPFFHFPGTIYRHSNLGLVCPSYSIKLMDVDYVGLEREEKDCRRWKEYDFFVVMK